MSSPILFHSDGSYTIPKITRFSNLYFPLFNYHGMKSAITPTLHGDIKIDQNHYLMIPVSQEDLKNPLNARNFFFRVDGDVWNLTGQTAFQKFHPDQVVLHNGLLYQQITRSNERFSVDITSFVPTIDQNVELHKVVFKNISKNVLSVKSVIGIPIFGRSADNLRDHRHVTSLLNRIHVHEQGISNTPTLSFDERGHKENNTSYGVFACSSKHSSISQYWPILKDFIGEGEDMFHPQSVALDSKNPVQVGDSFEGYEAIGGLEFSTVNLSPEETMEFIVSIEIIEKNSPFSLELLNLSKFDVLLEETKQFWQKDLITSDFSYHSISASGWLRSVGIQPLVRRIYGNSFLPHHDYGRGGRGWRDLWQDSLELVLKDPKTVRENLIAYFRGERIDGSNATIIGSKKGEFKADRNQIVRVWSDHGAWPFVTVNLYVHRTGDWKVLFEKQAYFKDQFTHYTKQTDSSMLGLEASFTKTKSGHIYEGTILEHVLIQNLAALANVGEHGNIRIEDADWNDGFDMAKKQGESVAFTHLYVGNLTKLICLLEHVCKHVQSVALLQESRFLFDSFFAASIAKRQAVLKHYFDAVSSEVQTTQMIMSISDLIAVLKDIVEAQMNHLRQNEWIETCDGQYGIYNGYYDNDGHRVERLEGDVQMTLTGQVFPLMAHVATPEQVQKILKSTHRYLKDETTGGYRLNTVFHQNGMSLGRFMGFAYGHKENGALFSHMIMMYAYSILDNGLFIEGSQILDDYIEYLLQVEKSKILPGIPEYIDPEGRGMYHFLTGSASWVILLMVEQIFGISAQFGVLALTPKLLKKHFVDNQAHVHVLLNGNVVKCIYENPKGLEAGQYQIVRAQSDGVDLSHDTTTVTIDLSTAHLGHEIKITLGEK